MAYTASRLRLKALTDKGIADAYAANPAAQQRLADGLSSSMHQAITDVGAEIEQLWHALMGSDGDGQ